MKRTYIKPNMCAVHVGAATMLAASGIGGKIGDSVEIGYGGVDDDGCLDADVRSNPYGDSIFD